MWRFQQWVLSVMPLLCSFYSLQPWWCALSDLACLLRDGICKRKPVPLSFLVGRFNDLAGVSGEIMDWALRGWKVLARIGLLSKPILTFQRRLKRLYIRNKVRKLFYYWNWHLPKNNYSNWSFNHSTTCLRVGMEVIMNLWY